MTGKEGFTLIELIVVITLLSIVGASFRYKSFDALSFKESLEKDQIAKNFSEARMASLVSGCDIKWILDKERVYYQFMPSCSHINNDQIKTNFSELKISQSFQKKSIILQPSGYCLLNEKESNKVENEKESHKRFHVDGNNFGTTRDLNYIECLF